MIIKKILVLLIVLFSKHALSQCNVQTNIRDDGATIRYISPDRVGAADKFFMGASMQTNGTEFYVAVISIFPQFAQDLMGDMIIKFENCKSSTLEHITSKKTTFNGYPATLSIFYADKSDLLNITTSNLKYILAQLNDGTFQNVIVSMNFDILKKQYNCLK